MPLTVVPAGITSWLSTTTSCTTVAENLSPECADAVVKPFCSLRRISVPCVTVLRDCELAVRGTNKQSEASAATNNTLLLIDPFMRFMENSSVAPLRGACAGADGTGFAQR